MSIAAPFAAQGNQTLENLVHLRDGEIVGEWRDSTYGIGGARIPYDVNTALVPAALRAIGQLTRAGFYPSYGNWSALTDGYAQIWEDQTLQFFEVTVPQAEAQQRLQQYVQQANFSGPTGNVTGDVLYYGLGRDGYNNQSTVLVMNSDDCKSNPFHANERFPPFPSEYYKSNSTDYILKSNCKSSQCSIPTWTYDGCRHARCKPRIWWRSSLRQKLHHRSLPRHCCLGMAFGTIFMIWKC
jgi:hypothetical protein